MATSKKAPAATPAAPKSEPAKPEVEEVRFFRSGATQGASGKRWLHTRGQVLTVPVGEFDHLFGANGLSRYAEKK